MNGKNIILIHGENYYANCKSLEDLMKDCTNPKVVDAEKISDANEVLTTTKNLSLFVVEEETTIVKRLGQNKKKSVKDQIAEYLENHGTSGNLIFFEPTKLKKNSKLYKRIKKYGEVIESKRLTPRELDTWFKSQLEERKIKVSNDLSKRMLSKLGSDQMVISTELDKLELYLNSQKKQKVKIEDLNVLTTIDSDAEIWDLLDAYINRDRKKVIKLIDQLIVDPKDFSIITSVLATQLKLLYLLLDPEVSEEELSRDLKIHPYRISTAKRFVQGFNKERLKKLHLKLTNLDFSFKQGRMEPKLGLLLFSLSI